MYFFNHIIYCSLACAINLGTTVIITGGSTAPYTGVTEYNEEGYVRSLPPLQQGRYTHGCSFFHDGEGAKVDIEKYSLRFCTAVVIIESDFPGIWRL